jgi:hypothetical protein
LITSANTSKASSTVGVYAAGTRADAPVGGVPAPAPEPVRFLVSANTISGVSFFKKPSFCDAITSPEILSLPVENSFIASAWPVAICMKSESDISSVQTALPTAPS